MQLRTRIGKLRDRLRARPVEVNNQKLLGAQPHCSKLGYSLIRRLKSSSRFCSLFGYSNAGVWYKKIWSIHERPAHQAWNAKTALESLGLNATKVVCVTRNPPSLERFWCRGYPQVLPMRLVETSTIDCSDQRTSRIVDIVHPSSSPSPYRRHRSHRRPIEEQGFRRRQRDMDAGRLRTYPCAMTTTRVELSSQDLSTWLQQ
jgi:hypothetical protein